MESARTRGHPEALRAVDSMVRSGFPHALLIVGPESVGKTTLALDIAAAALCGTDEPAGRPCRECRACRLISSGNHPDLHWLRPEGPGGQIRIGGSADSNAARGVRDLIVELALLPMEGSNRIAIVEQAHRMNDDAQNAILKLLEEPPAGATIILCADEEDRLLPTVRSRVARLRLGPVAGREIEQVLVAEGLADAPTSARLARLAHGRPGLAITLARAPDVVRLRDELARSLLDLLDSGRRARLARVRELLGSAGDMADQLLAAHDGIAGPLAPFSVGDDSAPGGSAHGGGARTRGKGRARGRSAVPPAAGTGPADGTDADTTYATGGAERRAPSERRRAAQALLETWRAVGRDLAVVAAGGRREVDDPALIDELAVAGPRVSLDELAAFLIRLEDTGRILESNANPELALDVLVLAWPHAQAA